MKNSFFIVLDGLDGSGKSEMLKQLHNYIFSKNKKCRILTTREPTSGTYGGQIREKLQQDIDPGSHAEELLELFLKDRKEHMETVVQPFLDGAKGEDINIVLCDRFYHSTIAFQSTQGLDTARLVDKNKGFLKPDLTLLLDLEPSISLERMKERPKEKFEREEFMVRLREAFLGLPKILDENIKIIDASKSKEEVFSSIKKEVDMLLEE